tara:strand:- start:13015 stop:13740 length:726 start_codon:yes stop_codon:yes gene_type:complete
MTENIKVGVLTGLTAEAKALGRVADNFSVATSAANPKRGEERLEKLVNSGANIIGSIGVAGGIKPGLVPGNVVIGSGVSYWSRDLPDEKILTDDLETYSTPSSYADKHWLSRITEIFGDRAVCGKILGVDVPVPSPVQKKSLHEITGAISIDMESHIVARVADRANIPWFAIRIISDPVERRIPSAALAAIGSEREISVARVIWALIKKPTDLVGLVGVAGETSVAMRSLKKAGKDFRGLL